VEVRAASIGRISLERGRQLHFAGETGWGQTSTASNGAIVARLLIARIVSKLPGLQIRLGRIYYHLATWIPLWYYD
jgi:hypothetical protein